MLDISEINIHYGESHIVKNLSISVKAGEIVGFLGRNGAGKTTTLRAIAGLHPPTSGSIHFKGTNISNESPEKIHKLGMGFVSEEKRLFPTLTVEENLVIGMDSDQAREDSFKSIFEFFPVLEERLHQRAKSLSGGEQQMLAISRAFISEPDLLLIDEPTEGLMPTLVKKLFDIIDSMNRDHSTSILLVDQNFEEILEISDRIYIINDGEIVHETTPDNLSLGDEIAQNNLMV